MTIMIMRSIFHICCFNSDALAQEIAYSPQRNREIIVDQAVLELTTFRLKQHRQLSVVAKLPEPLHWRLNNHDGVSNHQPHGCLLNRLFRRRSKKTSKLRVTGLCAGNSPGPVKKCGEFTGAGEFPAQRASNAENVSVSWRHHGTRGRPWVSSLRFLEIGPFEAWTCEVHRIFSGKTWIEYTNKLQYAQIISFYACVFFYVNVEIKKGTECFFYIFLL